MRAALAGFVWKEFIPREEGELRCGPPWIQHGNLQPRLTDELGKASKIDAALEKTHLIVWPIAIVDSQHWVTGCVLRADAGDESAQSCIVICDSLPAADCIPRAHSTLQAFASAFLHLSDRLPVVILPIPVQEPFTNNCFFYTVTAMGRLYHAFPHALVKEALKSRPHTLEQATAGLTAPQPATAPRTKKARKVKASGPDIFRVADGPGTQLWFANGDQGLADEPYRWDYEVRNRITNAFWESQLGLAWRTQSAAAASPAPAPAAAPAAA
mmetsp:Transcript_9863/g.33450  ORF Transcript_9863/g.33450 Transcript_9863/m.33450 type:complete len:270 (+) Transcript_9863:421-1230(+)